MGIEVNENKIIFKRDFEATAEQIFQAYTERALFEQWFHPQNATTEVFEFNIKKGGQAFFAIYTNQGASYTLTKYNEVKEPNLIDYYDYFADKEGHIDKNMAGMDNIIQIEQKDDTITRIISTAELPHPKSARQLLDMGVEDGMNSTFDNLESLLKNM
ncbi:SRPBCC domain-containing protein [Staphylococcus nepalensis]|uniref:SRPBCC family protein n=1 Tax=Staphylococcus nepalensis TaxID=214473 RepID=UPI003517B634